MSHVSICIPAYNAARFLPRTFDSIREQTWKDWELIVAEDASDDGTEELVNAFGKQVEQPVRYVRREQNGGCGAARNTAFSVAKGDCLAILDADDWWREDHLELCVRAAEGANCCFVYSGSLIVSDDAQGKPVVRAPTKEQLERFPLSLYLGEFSIQPSSVMITKTVVERVGGFDESLRAVEDVEYWLRCARSDIPFRFSDENTCFYYRHSENLSLESAFMADNRTRVFRKHFDWEGIPIDVRRKKVAKVHADAGRLTHHTDPERAFGYFLEALKTQPFQLRYLAYAAHTGLRTCIRKLLNRSRK